MIIFIEWLNVFVVGISYLLPSETDRLMNAIKKRHEHHSLSSLPKPAFVASSFTSPTTVIGKINQTGADNGISSPVVPPKDAADIPDQHQPFIHSVL